MMRETPADRPTIDQVVARWHTIRSTLSVKTLRMRLVGREEDDVSRLYKGFVHAFRTASYILRSIPPVPK